MVDGVYTALESEGIADGSVKIAAVDISSMTGQYFQNGVQVWTCGGQYATAMVAWAVLYNYLMDGTRIIPDPAQPLIRQYIEITSYEEYEQYVKYVEGALPSYDADEIAGRAGRRKYVSVLYADDLAHRHKHMLVVKAVLHFEHTGYGTAHTHIIEIAPAAHFKGTPYHKPLQGIHPRYLGLHRGIYLLPEARHTAHTCRMHLTYRGLYVMRVEIDVHLHARKKTEVCPCLLEYMAHREEADGGVAVAEHDKTLLVHVHSRVKT